MPLLCFSVTRLRDWSFFFATTSVLVNKVVFEFLSAAAATVLIENMHVLVHHGVCMFLLARFYALNE